MGDDEDALAVFFLGNVVNGSVDALRKSVQILAAELYKIISVGERRILAVGCGLLGPQQNLLQIFSALVRIARRYQLRGIAGPLRGGAVYRIKINVVLPVPVFCGLCLLDSKRSQGRIALALVHIHDVK